MQNKIATTTERTPAMLHEFKSVHAQGWDEAIKDNSDELFDKVNELINAGWQEAWNATEAAARYRSEQAVCIFGMVCAQRKISLTDSMDWLLRESVQLSPKEMRENLLLGYQSVLWLI